MAPAHTAALLSALATELADMRGTVEGLSDMVMNHVLLSAPQDRSGILTQAQEIDALSQNLHALQDLSRALSEGSSMAAALESIPLAGLSDRLRRAVLGVDHATPPSPVLAGDLMLFD